MICVFDLKVRNATYARLKSSESSDFFTPIEFVKKDDARVSIAFSIEHDGDLQVVMSKEDARRLVAALMTAIA